MNDVMIAQMTPKEYNAAFARAHKRFHDGDRMSDLHLDILIDYYSGVEQAAGKANHGPYHLMFMDAYKIVRRLREIKDARTETVMRIVV